MLRTQDRHRVRVEGDRDDLVGPEVPGDRAGAMDHRLVPEMDAVEVADGHDRASEVGRKLAEGSPCLHGR